MAKKRVRVYLRKRDYEQIQKLVEKGVADSMSEAVRMMIDRTDVRKKVKEVRESFWREA